MQRKFSKFVTVLAVCLMAFPCLTYAASSNTSAPSHSSDKAAVTSPSSVKSDLSDGVIYGISISNASSGSSFTGDEFATYSGNVNDIRVWYDNQGSGSVKVTLYKADDNSKIGSFTVAPGKNKFSEYSAATNTSYYINVASDDGSSVKGTLRARQLDQAGSSSNKAVAASPSSVNGDLYDNPSIGSKSEFDTYKFSTPDNNSNNIRVWFDNQGNETVSVVLYRASDDSKLGSFAIAPGKNVSADYTADASTSYNVRVTSEYGGKVEGYLRVRQL